ncbi:MAG: cytochrome b/b6 domain-containing protein [Candidatus Aminicenantes bacterium]|nr:cytochrome b/b6 domain-containing protein [Candidatus Aminicenantes bacterium]
MKKRKPKALKFGVFKPLFLSVLLALFCYSAGFAEMTNADCLTCHGDKELEAETERGKTLTLFVPEDVLAGSVHEDLSCTDCHKGDKKDVFEDVPHGGKPLRVDCHTCHEDIYSAFVKEDIHGRGLIKKNPRAPDCYHCHSGHDILPMSSPDSRMSKKNQPDTCGSCHGQEKLNLEDNITKRNLISRYKASVHYEAILMGKNGANCTDCHSHHNILSSASPRSGVSRTGLADSCQKCHSIEAKSFWTGAHGAALLHGNNDVPNCSTCHGDHDMASLRSRMGDAKQWASTQVCIWCHGNSRMMARYGLDTTPVDSYMKDFHGLTQRGTMGASATCSDCHDPHHSLPANHPSSRMHISNRGPTCGRCHGKVADSFAMSFTHKKALQDSGGRVESIIRIVYIFIIVFAVGGMLCYTFIVWLWAVRRKIIRQRKLKQVRRMTGFERGFHYLLWISFSVLVVTGFALKFPEAFWVKWLFAMGMNETIRAFIHRFSAFLMTMDMAILIIYMAFAKRGKGVTYEMLPRKRDFTDFFKALKFYLGLSKEKSQPKYAIFNFAEKFEFWALMWGTLVMLLSGLILWFPKSIPAGWPAWIIGAARVLHFYEAVLATLAILIWHGFHTILHPDEYPMNTAWLTGYITEEEAGHHFEDEAIKKMKKSAAEKEKKEDKE